jgi:hypothetical protein
MIRCNQDAAVRFDCAVDVVQTLHVDLANAVALALLETAEGTPETDPTAVWPRRPPALRFGVRVSIHDKLLAWLAAHRCAQRALYMLG